MKLPKVTLEQWATFKAVVDEGSFSKAAEELNKSQSSISYAIAKLEEQLPSPVLSLSGRKATLTEEGKVLYRSASQLLDLAQNIEQTASCLSRGWETVITIGMDSIVELAPILNVISRFSEDAPNTRIVLLEGTLSGTVEALLERKADLVLSAQTPPGFLGRPVSDVTMIPVAHTNHALSRLKHEITEQDLMESRQIVVRDSGIKRNQDTGWLGSEQRLTVSHFNQSIQAVNHGLGFAFIPSHLTEGYIRDGVFKKLNLAAKTERRIQIYLTIAMPDNVGPGTELLQKLIVESY